MTWVSANISYFKQLENGRCESICATTTNTHDHSSGFPLAAAELLVRLVDHQVQEHVVPAQNARDLSSALDMDKETTVHKFCGQLNHIHKGWRTASEALAV